jgi:hypothetical protein
MAQIYAECRTKQEHLMVFSDEARIWRDAKFWNRSSGLGKFGA